MIELDAELARWLHAHATPGLTAWLLVITHLHSTVAISCYSAIVGVWLLVQRRRRWLVALAVCMAGGLTLNAVLKIAFARARPVFDDPLLTLASYSFPSGHVVGTTLFYGLGVVALFATTERLRWRMLALLGAAAMIVLVAFTRMYLGVHYLSDVVAAFVEAVVWLALCLSGLAAYRRRTGAPLRPAGARH